MSLSSSLPLRLLKYRFVLSSLLALSCYTDCFTGSLTRAYGASPVSAGSGQCQDLFRLKQAREAAYPSIAGHAGGIRQEVSTLSFDFPGMRIGTYTDPTLSTGVTGFFFPALATAAVDVRGGSPADSESGLLAPGSYDATVNGIMFNGGSIMGLEAPAGARGQIFKEISESGENAGVFDSIASVPSAVVYDFGSRIEPGQNPTVYPTKNMGRKAYLSAVENQMLIGRVGAGTSTTANKISKPIWGGQGGAFTEYNIEGTKVKLFAGVVLNAHGDIVLPSNVTIDKRVLQALHEKGNVRGAKKNTTLSIIVTNIKLDRNQLQRLAIMVHTNMASMIQPFHTYTDGDVLYALSTNQIVQPKGDADFAYEFESHLQGSAIGTMKQAIYNSVVAANTRLTSKTKDKEEPTAE